MKMRILKKYYRIAFCLCVEFMIMNILVSQAQIISTVAGNNSVSAGYSGDGGAATEAQLNLPNGVPVMDADGNIYFADAGNQRVRKIDAVTKIISTIAGNGNRGFSGDGGNALAAQLNYPSCLAIDKFGNIYIADSHNQRIRKIDAVTKIISTIAGNGSFGYSGDGGLALEAQLGYPQFIAIDTSQNIYLSDTYENRIRKIDLVTNTISAFAGTGIVGFSGDEGDALNAQLDNPHGLCINKKGNLFFADGDNNRIRRIDNQTNIITTVAGNGIADFSGDGKKATSASLKYPTFVAFDADNNLFISDAVNYRIRKVDNQTQIISTIAGNGIIGFSGDGGPAADAEIAPDGIGMDKSNNLMIVEGWNNRVRVVNALSQNITTLAGNYLAFAGDGSAANEAVLNLPQDIAFDKNNNLYFSDALNNRIRKIDAVTNIITTVAGNGMAEFSGDSIPAVEAQLGFPQGITTDTAGNIYFSDYHNGRIRKISVADNKIYTAVGSGARGGLFEENLPASEILLSGVQGLAIDGAGNIYIADFSWSVIWKVDAVTMITKVIAGNISWSYSGDGGLARDAELYFPWDIAVDKAGNIFIADAANNRIRKVDAVTNIITTIAGTGVSGQTGDGGPATEATISFPVGISLDSSENIYIAEGNNIRKIDKLTNIISTVAGQVNGGYGGDGGLATDALLSSPTSVTFDKNDKMFIADYSNNVIRKVDAGVLPLRLISFNGVLINERILLIWKTTNEINSDYFSLEKSRDGAHFVEIAKVKSSRNAAITHQYNYEDDKPYIGKNYYRVKTIDKDGKYNYSGTINLLYNKTENIKLYPNPAKDIITINGLSFEIPTLLTIINDNGRIVKQQMVTDESYSMDIKSLPAGIYYLQATWGTLKSVLKFIKE